MAAISALLLLGALAGTYCFAHQIAHILMQDTRLRGALSPGHIRHIAERIREHTRALPLVSRTVSKALDKQRQREFERGMPEVLRLLSISLESGASLVMALRYAANNCDEPLAGELKRTVWDLEAGHGFEEAIEGLRARTKGSEFAYLAVAMEIQHQSGGSLTVILENLSGMLQQNAELAELLETKTSQGRLSSKIVAIMPFALLGILTIFTPDYLLSFLDSPLGVCLLLFALLLELTGIVLVRKSLAIDFGVDLEEGV